LKFTYVQSIHFWSVNPRTLRKFKGGGRTVEGLQRVRKRIFSPTGNNLDPLTVIYLLSAYVRYGDVPIEFLASESDYLAGFSSRPKAAT
jgi:hypothetical protein